MVIGYTFSKHSTYILLLFIERGCRARDKLDSGGKIINEDNLNHHHPPPKYVVMSNMKKCHHRYVIKIMTKPND